MIIRWTAQTVKRDISSYRCEHGWRRTLWFLFIPLFSITRWPPSE